MWSPPVCRERFAESQTTPNTAALATNRSAAMAATAALRPAAAALRPAASQLLQLPTVPPPSSQLEGPATWDGTPQDTDRFEHPLAREQDQLAVLDTSLESAMCEYLMSTFANGPGEQAR